MTEVRALRLAEQPAPLNVVEFSKSTHADGLDGLVQSRPLAKAAASETNDLFAGVEVVDLLADFDLLHPDVVATVQVDLAKLGPTAVRLVTAHQARLAAEERFDDSLAERRRLSLKITLLRGELSDANVELAVAQVEERDAERVLADVAISTFITLQETGLSSSGPGISGSSFEAIASNSQRQLDGQLSGALDRRVAAENAVGTASLVLAETREESERQDLVSARADQDRVVAQDEIDSLQKPFERLLMGAEVEETGIPLVVFDAYYRAQLSVAEEQPRCEVSWHQLAGIGKVESSHGSFGGNIVGPDGRTDGEILGPVLDGQVFAEILDTDGGLLDGDTEWDRAVGPMQFIPGSWSIYGRDGNGDGIEDPHNVYDAALAAALHLCGTNSGLSEEASFTNALLGYNRSVSYGVLVKAFAEDYRVAVGEIVMVPEVVDSVDVIDISVRIA